MPLIGMAFLGIEWWILKMLLIDRSSDLSIQISLQRVAISPVSLYQSSQTPRREKTPKPEPETVPAREGEDSGREGEAPAEPEVATTT